MDILRKSLKAYIAAMIFFAAFTAILAAMVRFTPFREEWTFAGLIFSMTAASALLGYLESRVIGKRGLISGILAASIFVALILMTVGGIFSDMPEASKHMLVYLLPVAGGGAGGAAGIARES